MRIKLDHACTHRPAIYYTIGLIWFGLMHMSTAGSFNQSKYHLFCSYGDKHLPQTWSINNKHEEQKHIFEASNKITTNQTTSLQPGWCKLLFIRKDGHAETTSLLREAASFVQSRGWRWISGTDKDATETCAFRSLNGCCENNNCWMQFTF